MNSVRGIYTIRNTVNGNQYVGSAESIPARWKAHKYALRRGTHRNQHLQRAWDKYGENSFEFVVLRKLIATEDILANEQEFIDYLQPEYNILRFAGSPKGHVCTEETRRRMSIAAMNNDHGKANKGRVTTGSTKQKMSESKKARRLPPGVPSKHRRERTGYRTKPVSQFSKNMQLIATYSGVREAERQTGVLSQHISGCCNGHKLSAGGFIWRHV